MRRSPRGSGATTLDVALPATAYAGPPGAPLQFTGRSRLDLPIG
jgi:hypothetical protein